MPFLSNKKSYNTIDHDAFLQTYLCESFLCFIVKQSNRMYDTHNKPLHIL